MTLLAAFLFIMSAMQDVRAQGQESSAPVLLSIDEKGFDALRAKSKGRVLVLNFWATWCKPCVEEFPALLQLHNKYASRGLDFVLVSIDDDAKAKQKVTAFLRKMKVAFPSYIKATDDDEKFIDAVNPKWGGAVPATFVFNKEGKLVIMKVEELTKPELEAIVKPLL